MFSLLLPDQAVGQTDGKPQHQCAAHLMWLIALWKHEYVFPLNILFLHTEILQVIEIFS